MEEKKVRGGMKNAPQKDVPTELVIHYIVKDYRRMYEQHEDMLERIYDQAAEIRTLNLKCESLHTALDKERKEYMRKVIDVQNNRSAVVEAATDDLQEQITALKKQNALLVQAVVNPQDKELIAQAIALTTPEEKEWMQSSTKQLEKASTSLSSAIERLNVYSLYIERAEKEGIKEDSCKLVLKKVQKSVAKIESAIAHIDCFFDKIKAVKFE